MHLPEYYPPFDNPEGCDFEVRVEHLQPWIDPAHRSLQHAHALWSFGQSLLALASLAPAPRPLPARAFTFRPRTPVPAGSDCGPAK